MKNRSWLISLIIGIILLCVFWPLVLILVLIVVVVGFWLAYKTKKYRGNTGSYQAEESSYENNAPDQTAIIDAEYYEEEIKE